MPDDESHRLTRLSPTCAQFHDFTDHFIVECRRDITGLLQHLFGKLARQPVLVDHRLLIHPRKVPSTEHLDDHPLACPIPVGKM